MIIRIIRDEDGDEDGDEDNTRGRKTAAQETELSLRVGGSQLLLVRLTSDVVVMVVSFIRLTLPSLVNGRCAVRNKTSQ